MSTYACGHCGASLAFDGVRTETCPYCASPNFVERPPIAGKPDPQFVVTFGFAAERARDGLRRWARSRTWFADPALRRARVEDLRGIYVPAYLYSAAAHSEFHAQIGENYTQTETYRHTGPDGKTETRTRTVTRTEYRPLAGRHVGYITDVLVSASHGLGDGELARIEPFDLRLMRRFEPALVTGWIVEEPSRPADACTHASRTEAIDLVGEQLRKFMPGDSHSDLTWRTRVAWESLDPILVPVWVLALRYRDDAPPLRVVMNGQTGRIAGKVPLSVWRVALGVALLVAALVAIAYLIYTRSP